MSWMPSPSPVGYVDAQKEWALAIHDDSGVNQYAQKIFGTPGKQDGTYWKNPDGTSGGRPVGEGVAKALYEGYFIGKGGYRGYYFKILKGQGPDAPPGKIDDVIEGLMIGGFALVAVPAEYRLAPCAPSAELHKAASALVGREPPAHRA